MVLKTKDPFSTYSITVQKFPLEDESIVIEHFKLLLQMEICAMQ